MKNFSNTMVGKNIFSIFSKIWVFEKIFFDFFSTKKKIFFLELKKTFDYSFDAEKTELSIGAIFSAIRASFIG